MNSNGYTLFEVLVATMILGISLVILFELFGQGLRSKQASQDYTRAIFFAKEKIEELSLLNSPIESQEGEIGDGYFFKAQMLDVDPQEQVVQRYPYKLMKIIVEISWYYGTKLKKFDLSTTQIFKAL